MNAIAMAALTLVALSVAAGLPLLGILTQGERRNHA